MASKVTAPPQEEKRGRGQPTKYRPEYCEQVIAWGKEGKSLAQMAAELGVAVNTLNVNWPKQNPEFADALDLWHAHALSWWESKVEANLTNRDFQSHLFLRSMAARFPNDWRESTRSELTGPNGQPLNPPAKLPDLSHLDEAQLSVLASIKLRSDDDQEMVRH
jgi:transposase